MLNEFATNWILRYFALHPYDYSLDSIVNHLGVSYVELSEQIVYLISMELLEQTEGGLNITFKGRIKLQKENMEPWEEFGNSRNITFTNGMGLSQPYLEKKFSRKRWIKNK